MGKLSREKKQFSVALLGGSFDPPHNGHLHLIKSALDHPKVDEVWVLPAGNQPLKSLYDAAPLAYRLSMCSRVFGNMKGVRICLNDSLSVEPSYTAELLEELHAATSYRSADINYLRKKRDSGTGGQDLVTLKANLDSLVSDPEKHEITFLHTDKYLPQVKFPPLPTQFFWLCGSDVIYDLPRWHRVADLAKAVTFLVLARGGKPAEEDSRQAELLRRTYGFTIEWLNVEKISRCKSTALRRYYYTQHLDNELYSEQATVAAAELSVEGQTPELCLPSGLDRFIRDNAPYLEPNPMAGVSSETLKRIAMIERRYMTYMTEERLLHTYTVMYTALKLARIHQPDLTPDQVALAAFLHDCAKPLSASACRELMGKVPEDMLHVPQIWHGPAGAVLAKQLFDCADPTILNAIYWHSTLTFSDDPLTMLVFLADKIEPARTYDDLSPIRQATLSSLTEATILCLEAIKAKNRGAGRPIYPPTPQIIGYFIRNKKSKEETN
ncbi:MAG: HD domain-containing protein [Clostridiaceae bacterium]|nr:HD domain-containing protein [Clostridiaceae bacterium]